MRKALVGAALVCSALPAFGSEEREAGVERVLTLVGGYVIAGVTFGPECSMGQIDATMFSDPAGFSVRRAFEEASYGRDMLSGEVAGPFIVNAPPSLIEDGRLSCGAYPILSDLIAKRAAAAGFFLGDFDRVVYVLPGGAGCSPSNQQWLLGQTNLQGNEHWIFACNLPGVYQHEIGHDRFGNAQHSLDSDDPMHGSNGTLKLFNAPGAIQLGYLPDEAVVPLAGDGIFQVAALELNPGATGLPQTYTFAGQSGATYYLSYRQPIGVDRILGAIQDYLLVHDDSPERASVATVTDRQPPIGDLLVVVDGVGLYYLGETCPASGRPCSALTFRIDFPGNPPPATFTAAPEASGGIVTYSAQNVPPGATIGWNFGDDPSLSGPQETGSPRTHDFDFNGAYVVSMYVNGQLAAQRSQTIALAAVRCGPDDTTLCLGNDRFQVRVGWNNQHQPGHIGPGHRLAYSTDTGMFWFFAPANVEMVVKVLDGLPVNGMFWVFWGGVTDVEYTLSVRDMLTGQEETYFKPAGEIHGGVDTSFGTPDQSPPGQNLGTGSGASTPASCPTGSTHLCLHGGRIKVEVAWDTGPSSGAGTSVPLTGMSGLVWFFRPENIELVIKVVDARAIANQWWVFTGGLTDVAYDVRVTDTATGRFVTLTNLQGNPAGGGLATIPTN